MILNCIFCEEYNVLSNKNFLKNLSQRKRNISRRNNSVFIQNNLMFFQTTTITNDVQFNTVRLSSL